jgi:hypothetical protein
MSPAKQVYGGTFYRDQMSGSEMSAEVILPLLIEPLNIKSVVDVGCGVGTWLAVASRLGVPDIQGVEGHWVSKQKKRFRTTTSCTEISRRRSDSIGNSTWCYALRWRNTCLLIELPRSSQIWLWGMLFCSARRSLDKVELGT